MEHGWEGTGAHLLQQEAKKSVEAVRHEIRTGPWQCDPQQLMQLLSLWAPQADPTQGRKRVERPLEKHRWTPSPSLSGHKK